MDGGGCVSTIVLALVRGGGIGALLMFETGGINTSPPFVPGIGCDSYLLITGGGILGLMGPLVGPLPEGFCMGGRTGPGLGLSYTFTVVVGLVELL